MEELSLAASSHCFPQNNSVMTTFTYPEHAVDVSGTSLREKAQTCPQHLRFFAVCLKNIPCRSHWHAIQREVAL